MIVLPVLEFFFTGSYLTYVFLLMFAFGLFWKVIHL